MMLLLWLVLFAAALLSGSVLGSVLLLTWIAYWYPAWPLFIIAVLVDGYYGAFFGIPVISLHVGAFVLLVELLKLYLRGTVQSDS